MSEGLLWSSAPVLCYDGGNPPAEVNVIKGYGYVSEMNERGKAFNVKFMAHDRDGHARKFLPGCWISKNEVDFINALEDSFKNKTALDYRIEIHRKLTVDRTIPIKELTSTAESAKESIFRSLVALRKDGEEDYIFTKTALTDPEQDPEQNSLTEISALHNKQNAKKTVKEAPTTVPVTSNVKSIIAFIAATQMAEAGDCKFATKELTVLAKTILQISTKTEEYFDEGEDSLHWTIELIKCLALSSDPLFDNMFKSKESLQFWKKSIENNLIKVLRWSNNVSDRKRQTEDE